MEVQPVCSVENIIMSFVTKIFPPADGVSFAHHLAGVNPHSRHNMCQLSCWLSLGFRRNWWLKSSFNIKNSLICIASAAVLAVGKGWSQPHQFSRDKIEVNVAFFVRLSSFALRPLKFLSIIILLRLLQHLPSCPTEPATSLKHI